MDRNIIFSPAKLELAFERILASTQACSKDTVGIARIESDREHYLGRLSARLIKGRYWPVRPAKLYVPKASGIERTMTILRIEDELAYQAIADSVAQIVCNDLAKHQGFVFGAVLNPKVARGTKLLEVDEPDFALFIPWKATYDQFSAAQNRTAMQLATVYKLETDIAGFFDAISHQRVLDDLASMGIDDVVISWLQAALSTWSGTRDSATPGVGIPQGPAASHLFANMLLAPLDDEFERQGRVMRYYRYMDDIRILAERESDLDDALVRINRRIKGMGLTLNDQKTSIRRLEGQVCAEVFLEFRYADDFVEPIGPTFFDHYRAAEYEAERAEQDWADVEEALDDVSARLSDLIDAHRTPFDERSSTELELIKHQRNTVIGCSYAFRSCVKHLRDTYDCDPFLKQWLELLSAEGLYTVTNHICWAIKAIDSDAAVKPAMIQALDVWRRFEWCQGQILETLLALKILDEAELRRVVLQYIESPEVSWVVQLPAYRLLEESAGDEQLNQIVAQHKAKVSCPVLQQHLMSDAGVPGETALSAIKRMMLPRKEGYFVPRAGMA